MHIYIVYKINFWSYMQGADFTLGNSFFGTVNLTKNANLD